MKEIKIAYAAQLPKGKRKIPQIFTSQKPEPERRRGRIIQSSAHPNTLYQNFVLFSHAGTEIAELIVSDNSQGNNEE